MSAIFDVLSSPCHDFTPPRNPGKIAKSTRRRDTSYDDYLNTTNGGFYFENALHLYGISPAYSHHDIDYIHELINKLYGELSNALFFFGEDLFGNQFAFSAEGIVLFNIETAERKYLASNFLEWVTILEGDLNAITGRSLVPTDAIFELAWGKRLCPKLPFILGGDFKMENLVLKGFEENFGFNASIAKQIHELPDGTKFKITLK